MLCTSFWRGSSFRWRLQSFQPLKFSLVFLVKLSHVFTEHFQLVKDLLAIVMMLDTIPNPFWQTVDVTSNLAISGINHQNGTPVSSMANTSTQCLIQCSKCLNFIPGISGQDVFIFLIALIIVFHLQVNFWTFDGRKRNSQTYNRPCIVIGEVQAFTDLSSADGNEKGTINTILKYENLDCKKYLKLIIFVFFREIIFRENFREIDFTKKV